jgi:hypothetical protein
MSGGPSVSIPGSVGVIPTGGQRKTWHLLRMLRNAVSDRIMNEMRWRQGQQCRVKAETMNFMYISHSRQSNECEQPFPPNFLVSNLRLVSNLPTGYAFLP